MEASRRTNLILLGPQACPEGLLVAVKDPLDAAGRGGRRRRSMRS
jgi:hypothetical protein